MVVPVLFGSQEVAIELACAIISIQKLKWSQTQRKDPYICFTGAQLGKGAILFAVLSSIGAVLIGLLLYHEEATRAQYAGLVLGIGAIVFLTV